MLYVKILVVKNISLNVSEDFLIMCMPIFCLYNWCVFKIKFGDFRVLFSWVCVCVFFFNICKIELHTHFLLFFPKNIMESFALDCICQECEISRCVFYTWLVVICVSVIYWTQFGFYMLMSVMAATMGSELH